MILSRLSRLPLCHYLAQICPAPRPPLQKCILPFSVGNTTFFDCMTTPGGAEVCPTAISIADGSEAKDPYDTDDDDAVAVMYECAPLIARRPSATTCQLLANRAVPLANRPDGGPSSPPAANRTEFAGCYNQMVRRRLQGHKVLRSCLCGLHVRHHALYGHLVMTHLELAATLNVNPYNAPTSRPNEQPATRAVCFVA